uniref:Uncharacterized protein n=1 Tax=Rhizophora mucronata TaxID=61149 RepID=A0A2P2MRQ9_RHIMU
MRNFRGTKYIRVFCKMMMLVLMIQFGKERCNVN